MSAPLSNPEQFRKSITQRLLAAWECVPALRLGQLIDNAMGSVPMRDRSRASHVRCGLPMHTLFYVSDLELVERVEEYVRKLQ